MIYYIGTVDLSPVAQARLSMGYKKEYLFTLMSDCRNISEDLAQGVANILGGQNISVEQKGWDVELSNGKKLEVRGASKLQLEFKPSNNIGAGRVISETDIRNKLSSVDGYVFGLLVDSYETNWQIPCIYVSSEDVIRCIDNSVIGQSFQKAYGKFVKDLMLDIVEEEVYIELSKTTKASKIQSAVKKEAKRRIKDYVTYPNKLPAIKTL